MRSRSGRAGAASDQPDSVWIRDAAQRPGPEPIKPLQRQRQMRAALRGRHRVDLVDDHRLDPAEDLASLRADHQIERLGRGDQDVRRLSPHRPALGLRRVAGAQRHRDRRPDPLQRGPQVALDVVGEGLERRDVDDPDALSEALGLPREPVDPPEEGRQGLAGARRGADQGVLARGDRGPAGRLGGRGGLERRLEPLPDWLEKGSRGDFGVADVLMANLLTLQIRELGSAGRPRAICG